MIHSSALEIFYDIDESDPQVWQIVNLKQRPELNIQRSGTKIN